MANSGQIVMGVMTVDDQSGGDYEVIGGSTLIVNGTVHDVLVRKGGKLEVNGMVAGVLTNAGGDVVVRGRVNIAHDDGDGTFGGDVGSSVNEFRIKGKLVLGRDGYVAPPSEWPK